MSESKQFEQFEAVIRKFNQRDRLLRMWQPQGGVSAQIRALEVQEPDGRTRKMIVRRHGKRDLERNPKMAADEYRLLQLLQDEGIAAPAPLYLDQTCTIFPTPYLVIEYVEGESEFSPADLSDFLHQLAANLARIHAVDGAEAAFSFLPEASSGFSERPAHLDDSLNEGVPDDITLVETHHLDSPHALHDSGGWRRTIGDQDQKCDDQEQTRRDPDGAARRRGR